MTDLSSSIIPTTSRKPALLGDSESALAFERSRLVALFVAALLVPALLVLDGPRDWRLALLAATPTIPGMIALLTIRKFGVDTAVAVQFGLGAMCATIAAVSGFGFAVPALIVALMVIDSLLIGRRISGSPLIAVMVACAGLMCIIIGSTMGGFNPVEEVRSTLIWLVIPGLVQLGTAIVVWRKTTAWRRKSDHDQMGVLNRSVDRAQREVGVLLDGHGRVDDVTGNIRDVMGLRASDGLGRGLVDRLHVLDRPLYLKAVAEAAGDNMSCVLRLRFTRLDMPNGEKTFRWFEGRIFPVTGQSGAALMMIRDINEEMSILTADADRRNKAAEERLRRSTFLADLSHDVRTPLNAIIGFAELLSNPITQPKETDRITEYATIVHRSGRDLLQVVTMLVEMTRVENGAFEFIEELAKPSALLDGLRETLAEATERPDFAINGSGQLDCAEWLVDRRAARQVLFGIASNIVDEHGSSDLCVDVELEPEEICFSFKASGPQAGRPAGRRTVTAGLSTEVAKSLVTIMGGTIKFHEEGGSLAAILKLPLGGRGQEPASERPVAPIILADARVQRLDAVHMPSSSTNEPARRKHG